MRCSPVFFVRLLGIAYRYSFSGCLVKIGVDDEIQDAIEKRKRHMKNAYVCRKWARKGTGKKNYCEQNLKGNAGSSHKKKTSQKKACRFRAFRVLLF